MAPIFFFFFIFFTILTTTTPSSLPDLITSSCQHATFPKVCLHTLSLSSATTPKELAQAAIKVSISRASKASSYLSTLQKEANNNKREKGAVKDCAGQISESVDELRKTLGELKELRRGTFRWQMSNAETWVSAALTNEDTCLDGFKEIDGKVRSDVRRKVTNVAKVTSNALYLINRLDHP
ncbi:hypothetical protein OSB04_020661 [Centaurea solstitialis]|uniref:Pectinesterase inhibitor domain-containing protein n=1 Tax=Centaurea solstitialis TaxID=347529 RepID=A0AA38T0B9_9ASTR|nr:hypothetical protein OSB04_020661 [Centaurea solstitialis]